MIRRRSLCRFGLVWSATCLGVVGFAKPGWGYVERSRLPLPLHFDGAQPFANGRAGVRQGTWHGYIDHAGNVVIPLKYEDARRFREGLAAVEAAEMWGYIDKQAGR